MRVALALRGLALGLPAVLVPLVWPLRWLHAGAADFAVRAPEVPLVGRAALPLEWFPLLEPLPACAPFCLPLTPFEAFALQRTPDPAREPVAVRVPAGRAAEGRTSALVRRAGRLPGLLPVDDCAGLRSREWVAGRLKWGRAAADFAVEAGLRAAGVRGRWASDEMCESFETGEACETGDMGGADAASLGSSSSCASSSRSRECRK